MQNYFAGLQPVILLFHNFLVIILNLIMPLDFPGKSGLTEKSNIKLRTIMWPFGITKYLQVLFINKGMIITFIQRAVVINIAGIKSFCDEAAVHFNHLVIIVVRNFVPTG